MDDSDDNVPERAVGDNMTKQTVAAPGLEETLARRKSRTQRPFPAASFEDATSLAIDLLRIGSGQKVRRLTLFDSLKKAPESGTSRMMITNANRMAFFLEAIPLSI